MMAAPSRDHVVGVTWVSLVLRGWLLVLFVWHSRSVPVLNIS
ncbi:hypothetical protein SAMN05216276_102875 [Streptosporangium subroseum]|uniref:Uncharacterized protein n=1 Tax=Streptosporangium subroseum TaxID=106412 RepID=A0A239KS19_9ACTN|nr:hypothetical protein SAMN05216276_102875 [Streptosporangium subroseum]